MSNNCYKIAFSSRVSANMNLICRYSCTILEKQNFITYDCKVFDNSPTIFNIDERIFPLKVLLEGRVTSWDLCNFIQSTKNENKIGFAICMELKHSISALWHIRMASFRTLV